MEYFTLMIAAFGFIVSCVATYATVHQMKQSRLQSIENIKHNRLSVRPVLDTWEHHHDHENDKHILFWIQNKGLGTARILSWDFLIDNVVATENELYTDIDTEFNGYFSVSEFGKMSHNSYISKDEKVTILKLTIKDKFNDELIKILSNRYSIKINYESLYGDSYVYESPMISSG